MGAFVEDDAPAWVKKAASGLPSSISPTGGKPSLSQMLDDGDDSRIGNHVTEFHPAFSDDMGEEFAQDATPMASAGMNVHKRQVMQPKVTVDSQTVILEALFPNGIPAQDIKKAVFMSNIVNELIAYADGDVSALDNIALLIKK